MPPRPIFATIYPAIVISVLFVLALSYTGAGYNLHRLALCGFALFLWVALSISRLNFSHLQLAWGRLPSIVIVYLGWLFLAPTLSTYPYASSTTGMGLAVLPLTFLGWLVLPDHNREARWRLTWHFLLLCSVGLAVWGILDFLTLHQRARAIFFDSNAYAALINLFLVPAIYSYLSAPPSEHGTQNPRLLLCTIAALALAQNMSLSRGALLTFLAVLPLLLWLARRHATFRSRYPRLLAVLVLTFVVVKMVPLSLRDEDTFVVTTEQYTQDASIQARLLIWKSTWTMIEHSNLLYGTGLGTFKTYYPAYREVGESSFGNFAHNDYLQALLEGGLVQLGFFLALAVAAPIWLLFKSSRERYGEEWRQKLNGTNAIPDITPGLMLGIGCISIHALINFIHYVGPIALLTGLYLVRGWETTHVPQSLNLPKSMTKYVKPSFIKGLVIFLLAIPTVALLLDGAIFKFFGTNDSIHTRLEPEASLKIANLALTVRPGNPMPRIFLIRGLLIAAEKSDSPRDREALLAQAEFETETLSNQSPALAVSRHFYVGKIRVLKGDPDNLVLARADLQHAVQLVPSASGMRLELVKLYRRLGQEREAYQAVLDAKKWVGLEVDLSVLAMFVKEAQAVARHQNDDAEASYWTQLDAQLRALGYVG